MPEHTRHQPLNSGFTIVELMLAAAISATIALVSVALFKGGMLSYLYSARQASALSSARKAFSGDGSKYGLLWEAQGAREVQSLDPSRLTLTSMSGVTISYFVSGGSLYKVVGGSTAVLAPEASSLALNYYNPDAAGAVVESTAAVSASFVTARLTVEGKGPGAKSQVYYGGARLRNHP